MMVFAMPPERYVTMVLNPLLIGVAAIFLVLSANDLIGFHRVGNVVSAQPHSMRRRSQPPGISGTQPRSYYDLIVQRDIFNLTAAVVPSTITTKEDLQIKLLGTSHVTDDKPFAIVEDSGGNESVYRLGDTIPNAGRIIDVWQDRAVILHDNHRVPISIPQDETGAPDAEPVVPDRAERIVPNRVRPRINNPVG
jgi:type II secretory pathway component PulC